MTSSCSRVGGGMQANSACFGNPSVLGGLYIVLVTTLGWRRRGTPATVGARMHTSKWCAGCRTIGRKHEHGGGDRKDADLQATRRMQRRWGERRQDPLPTQD